jgi:hypothetical protein
LGQLDRRATHETLAVFGDIDLNVTSFGFTYHAHGHDLLQHEWQNASADQGGNSGDIRSE